MALISLRQPFDRFRGSAMDASGQGLVIYDSPKCGAVARRWFAPANPQSPNQVTVRSNLITAAQGFAALSSAEAAAWNLAAEDFVRTNALDLEYRLSGMNLYCQMNAIRLLNGLSISDTPPTKLTLPSIAATGITATIAASPANVLSVHVTNTLAPGGDTFHALILCSRPWTRPARQPRRNDFSMRDHATPSNNLIDLDDTDPVTAALTNTDVPVATANVIHIRVTPISADYIPGPVEVYQTVTIPAP